MARKKINVLGTMTPKKPEKEGPLSFVLFRVPIFLSFTVNPSLVSLVERELGYAYCPLAEAEYTFVMPFVYSAVC
jgi:hypothetical protein